MKLVDILARDLKVWPEGITHITQSCADYEIYDARDGESKSPLLSFEPNFYANESHTEAAYPVVTRAQWQAAVDALKDIPKFPSDDMAVDWSKAPLATHYTPGKPEAGMNAVYWRVIEGVTVRAWAIQANGSLVECNSSSTFNLERTDVIARIWGGWGLPPIGTECEGMDETGEWGKCKIVHHTTQNPPKALAVFGKDDSTVAFFIHYRPIRAAEQIAAEEREKAIGDMEKTTNYQITQSSARALYDAGYRLEKDHD